MKGAVEISEKVWKFGFGILIFLLVAGVLYVVFNVFSRNPGAEVNVITGTAAGMFSLSGRKKGLSMVLLLSVIFIITAFVIALTIYDLFSPEAQKTYSTTIQYIADNVGGRIRGLFGFG